MDWYLTTTTTTLSKEQVITTARIVLKEPTQTRMKTQMANFSSLMKSFMLEIQTILVIGYLNIYQKLFGINTFFQQKMKKLNYIPCHMGFLLF